MPEQLTELLHQSDGVGMRNEIRIGILGFAHGHVGTFCARWREQPQMGVRGWSPDGPTTPIVPRKATDISTRV